MYSGSLSSNMLQHWTLFHQLQQVIQALKQPWTITLPLPCLTIGTILFMNSVNLTTDVTRLRPSSSIFVSSVYRKYVSRTMWDEPVVSLLLLFLVSSGCCLLRTLPGCQFLLIHFPIVETWTLNLNMTSKACRSSDTVLGSFVISLMSCQYGLGVILLGQPVRNGFDVNDFVCQWFH